jgi:hypothetical protein
VERAVAGDQGRRIGARQLAERVVERRGWQSRVETRQRLPQPGFEDDIVIIRVVSLGSSPADRDVGTVPDGIAQTFQPGERGLLD